MNKMSWNYRVVKDEQGFHVTDVFYDKDGWPRSWGERHNILEGETFDELSFQIEAVQKAWAEPVLYVKGNKLVENE